MELVRGQRVKLADLTAATRLKFTMSLEGLEPSEVSYAGFLLSEEQVAVAPNAVVGDEQPKSEDGSVAALPRQQLTQSFEVDLLRLPSSAASVTFAVGLFGGQPGALGSAQKIKSGYWAVEADGKEIARYSFKNSDFGSDAALMLGEVYRKAGVWRLRSIGDGFAGGLAAMLSRFKVLPGSVGSGPGRRLGLSAAAGGVWLPKTWAGERTPAVPRELTRCVGLMICRTADGTVHTGTGFVVSPGGHLITCHHVIHDSVDTVICFEGTKTLRKVEVIASDPDSDLALCWLSDKNGAPDWLILAATDLESGLGDELGLLGYPLGASLGISVTYSQGIVNSLRKDGEVPVFQIDVGAAPGSSGGPVFRRSDGKVIGVLTSGLHFPDRGMLINFAVDIRTLWRLAWAQQHS